MAIMEEPPPYEDPEFDPESERLLLLEQFRTTFRDCDANGVLETVWHSNGQTGYMALICGGIVPAGGYDHSHIIGATNVVSLASGESKYQLFSRCNSNGITQEMHSIRTDRLTMPTTEDKIWRDIDAHYVLTHTRFNRWHAQEYVSFFRKLHLGELADPSVAALLQEDNTMTNWRKYGEFLARKRRGENPGA